jgi:uncharacterized membrane protein
MTLRRSDAVPQAFHALQSLAPGALRGVGGTGRVALTRAAGSVATRSDPRLSLLHLLCDAPHLPGDVVISAPAAGFSLPATMSAPAADAAARLCTVPVEAAVQPTPAAGTRKVAEPITRDLTKTISFLILHLLVGFTVAYLFTGSLAIASGIALVEPLVNAVVFFFHERAWRRTDVPLLDILTHRHSRTEA